MPKKETKSWKERQRERQTKQQRSQETYQRQREREAKTRPRKLPKGKLIFGVCLIALVFTAYGTWQYYEGQKPPTIGGAVAVSPPTGSAPDFSLRDINGTNVSLSQFSGKVIGIHFMAVGCHGQINPINEYQLTQLKSACNSLCGKESATILTVAVATCPSSDLGTIRANYGVTWVLGNDYDDGVLDIVNAYVPFSIGDGSVVLVDKSFNVAEVYSGGVTANTLSSKINQLLKA
jgi:peroxiredoxin